MTIEDRLKHYRTYVARIASLEYNLTQLQALLASPEKITSEMIEGLSLPAMHMDERPGKVSRRCISSPVEMIADEVEKVRQEMDSTHAYLAHRIAVDQQEIAKLRAITEPIRIALSGLSAREKFVIEKFYFEELSWYMVQSAYQNEYKLPISPRGLRGIRTSAIRKLKKLIA